MYPSCKEIRAVNLRDSIKKNGFVFNKRFGQNFISDTNLLDAIAYDAGINSEDTVVEIGTGGGTLTLALAKKAKKVVSFEIDKNLQPVLADTLAGAENIEVVFRDFMKVSEEEIREFAGGDYKVVANLPYYITTPVIMRLAEKNMSSSITVMVQKEVAERLAAKVGSKDYGAITAQLNLTSSVEITRNVNRNMFFPPPNVDSAVVKITFDKEKQSLDFSRVRRLIKVAFAMRRKTLINNLVSAGINKEKGLSAISKLGFSPDIRGEKLSSEDFVNLEKELYGEIDS